MGQNSDPQACGAVHMGKYCDKDNGHLLGYVDDTRLKVVLITHYWKKSKGGGVRVYLTNLAHALENNGCDVKVIYREGHDPEQIHCPSNRLAFAFTGFWHLRRIQPDIIFAHGTWYTLLAGVFYKLLHSCTLAFTIHSEPLGKMSPVARFFYQSLLNCCDCVTFVSKGLLDRVIEVDGFSFPKIAITYGGVNNVNVSSDDEELFRSRFKIPQNEPVLLVQAFTDNQLKAEGLKLVIRALDLLRAKYPNIILLVTKEGRFSNELLKYSSDLGLNANVIFTGNLENPFIPLSICDIFLFPWLGKSGVGLALLEAMSAGKPSLVIDTGNGSEAIDDGVTGLLVDSDPKAIAERIDDLIKNPDLRQTLGSNARMKADKCFTWDKSAKTFISLYTERY
ncbi:MAG: glycosyltransferase family 4 protein [Methanospirillum sp.]